MSKKPRPKKRYRPRSLAVPPYLGAMKIGTRHNHEAEDRAFLLRVANRTADAAEVVKNLEILQCGWVLASSMAESQTLRTCLKHGVQALDKYLDPEGKEFDRQSFEALAQSVEVCRDIIEHAGQLERDQAFLAVVSGKVDLSVFEDNSPKK